MASGTPRVLAGIDLGTLTCRLLIAKVTADGALTEVHSDRKVLRLGEGVALCGRLSDGAMTRVIDTLREWRGAVQGLGVEAEAVVATSAVRDAENRKGFIQRVKAETGFEVEVISGQEEARRTTLGLRAGLPPNIEYVLGVDIGGGSTEFILDRSEQTPTLHSMNLGVVRSTEELLQHDPPTPKERSSARDLIFRHVQEFKSGVGSLEGVTLVGTAGTITTLAAMAQKLPTYDPARIHHYALALSTVCELEDDLASRAVGQRRGMPGLEPGREDVILAGAMILRGVMETLDYDTCLVSDLGLREGIIIDLATRLQKRDG